MCVYPYASNINLHTKSNNIIRKVVFIRTPYGNRVNLIKILTKGGVKVDLYRSNSYNVQSTQNKNQFIFINKLTSFISLASHKNGRKIIYSRILQYLKGTKLELNQNLKIYSSVETSKLGEIYSKYALCLSSASARNTGILNHPVEVINLRLFEIQASGGIQLIKKTNDSWGIFGSDKSTVFFESNRDVVRTVQNHLELKTDEEIKLMQRNAYINAKLNNTWINRFDKVNKLLKIKPKRI